jgi:23S rRNA pseudouridine1911/1915/1917 synthase
MGKKKEGAVKIVFEDSLLLVLDKPTGLVVHSDGRTEEESVVSWLTSFWVGRMSLFQKLFFKQQILEARGNVGNPHTLDSGRYEKRCGIVNRLDRDTSGLILIAKDEKTFSNLQKQFQENLVRKEYEAVVWGEVDLKKLIDENKISMVESSEEQVYVDKKSNCLYRVGEPISRHKKDPRIWVSGTNVGERATKRSAETFFEIIHVLSDKKTALRFFPRTGRTHQLRLHSRFLDHPIVGDKKYGVSGIANEHGTGQIQNTLRLIGEQEEEHDKNSRLLLHSKSLTFMHPNTNEVFRVASDFSVF